MIKIYTKSGDDGTTGLYRQGRVSKASDLIETIGAVDELNAHLGMLMTFPIGSEMLADLTRVQNQLFDLGAYLASPAKESQTDADMETSASSQTLSPAPLEKRIDQWQSELPEIRQFILPGGTTEAATSHVCRCECRKTERMLVGLSKSETRFGDDPEFRNALVFINRLSDYLFVAARFLNHKNGVEDVFWKPVEKE